MANWGLSPATNLRHLYELIEAAVGQWLPNTKGKMDDFAYFLREHMWQRLKIAFNPRRIILLNTSVQFPFGKAIPVSVTNFLQHFHFLEPLMKDTPQGLGCWIAQCLLICEPTWTQNKQIQWPFQVPHHIYAYKAQISGLCFIRKFHHYFPIPKCCLKKLHVRPPVGFPQNFCFKKTIPKYDIMSQKPQVVAVPAVQKKEHRQLSNSSYIIPWNHRTIP